MKRWSILLLALAPAAFAQLDSDTVTITVSRQITYKPDQFVLNISAIAPVSLVLDDVVAGLEGTGITAAQFVNVSQSYQVFTGNSAVASNF